MSPPRTPYPGLETIKDPATRQVAKLLFDKLGAVELSAAKIGTVSQPLATPLNANSQQLKGVADPSHPQDAVTLAYLRKYVESRVQSVVTAAAPATPPIPQSDGPVVPTPGTPSTPPTNAPPSSGTFAATDMIPPATVIVLNSPPAMGWAQTATLTDFDFQTTGVFVDFNKKSGGGRWPDVLYPGSTDPTQTLQYTLWGFLNIGGQWYASGVIQFWFGLDRNGGPPSQLANNWFYDPGRWGPMSGHQPAVGETVGFMLSAGNARNQSGVTTVAERTQIITIPFPSDAGGVFT